MDTNGLNTNVTLFMDNTSFFLKVRGIVASAEELNNDLIDKSKRINQWKR